LLAHGRRRDRPSRDLAKGSANNHVVGVKMNQGYLEVGRFGGVALRVHALTLLGALIFTGFRLAPVAWFGFFALVLAHETGHALLARGFGLRVESIDLNVFGGACRWSGPSSAWQRAVIAWGGVLAQAAILLVSLGFLFVAGPPRSFAVAELADVFTRTNLWIMGLNLLPVRPLDGADAWKVVPELRARWAARRRHRLVPPARRAGTPLSARR
jgi:Zn-dependent protease